MRILFAHNFYQQKGGEESVLEAEMDLVTAHGHDARLFSVHNDAIVGLADKARVLARLADNPESARRLREEIDAFKPDLLHVHNQFPQLSPSIYAAAAGAGVPVVQTLHNFRTVCAGTFLFRDGRICETCLSHSPYWGAVHRCYRGSLPGSLAVAHAIATHRHRRTWQTMVNRFIAPSSFVRQKFIEAGFPSERIVTKPHFMRDPGRPGQSARHGALFVGRISSEKGVRTLVDGWRAIKYPLRIAGAGPLLDELQRATHDGISFLGQMSRDGIRREMERAAFLIVPSEWYEVFGMVVIEAFAAGLPVVATRAGALPEIIEDGVTGLIFEPQSSGDLGEKVRWAVANADALAEMGRRARSAYEERFTTDVAYPALLSIYADAIADADRRQTALR